MRAEPTRYQPTPGTKPPPHSLDDLGRLDADALEALYRGGRVPRMSDLRGDLEGRMLASPFAGRRLGAALRLLASWRGFPWRGKSFTPYGELGGEGQNRVLSDVRMFRFETSIGRSRSGDFD